MGHQEEGISSYVPEHVPGFKCYLQWYQWPDHLRRHRQWHQGPSSSMWQTWSHTACVFPCVYFTRVCVLQVWDLRQNKLIYSMQGHGDSVTGLSLSSEGSYLLSNSMDNSGEWLLLISVRDKAMQSQLVRFKYCVLNPFLYNLSSVI